MNDALIYSGQGVAELLTTSLPPVQLLDWEE